MTYSEKLRDPRWLRFRDAYIERMKQPDEGACCWNCGDKPYSFHVHHRKYIRGREPWEYDDDSLMLLCGGCHQVIHDTEDRVRAIVRAMEPHVCTQINEFLDEIEEAMARHIEKAAFANATSAVKRLLERTDNPEVFRLSDYMNRLLALHEKYGHLEGAKPVPK